MNQISSKYCEEESKPQIRTWNKFGDSTVVQVICVYPRGFKNMYGCGIKFERAFSVEHVVFEFNNRRM